MSICPRIHFYEINDQAWFPSYLRSKVQASLTLAWRLKLPLIQHASPASLVSSVLRHLLNTSKSQYTIVDFCAGAGGPTPTIEKLLNEQLASETKAKDGDYNAVDFILTDLHPHLDAWQEAVKKSDNLKYISKSIDAANAPSELIKKKAQGRKVIRLFNLAFHHFDDELATQILKNTIETADGFGIFELQNRTLPSLLTITTLFPLFLLLPPFYFYNSPGHLFFTYIIPIIPLVITLDGYVSALRTRTPEEILALVEKSGVDVKDWRFSSGKETHTWATGGTMNWMAGMRGERGERDA
ncbi:MAG: hypothetical protein M1812_007806 [Candelaria pacifica]|nr:MAG: hypothetical protein M1812_007806 [Candelaria pacifica]